MGKGRAEGKVGDEVALATLHLHSHPTHSALHPQSCHTHLPSLSQDGEVGGQQPVEGHAAQQAQRPGNKVQGRHQSRQRVRRSGIGGSPA